ncbi:monovalent cation/H+ antiporter subunit D family protein [Marinicella sp. S1101]|uniref:monovalent cation/H+ antiporter subunit D family protein n=1 Tax=Marinicella marina TaxID=2996016 RepID=UPI002260F3BA|nr:monovalent cation/H+ antiporter subunit D family protein [Marinicella marina]MCX7555054.1 monovalent cation/H+ antiporter subunit D family protein [Marinicella marina]MDJ1141362.1 monovalent cation/H+ antiporter subunit D family protein [Marinicella marina]
MMLSYQTMLQLAVVMPLLAIPLILITRNKPNLREACSIGIGLILFYLVINLYHGVTQGEVISAQWVELVPGLGINFSIEPLGMLFALIASFLWLVTTVYAIGYMRDHNEQNQTRFFCFFAFAISGVMGVAFAADLFTLFIFYEVLTLSTYPLVTHAGTDKAKAGGRVYLGILLSTSIVFFLFAIISTWFVAGTLTFTAGGVFAADVNPVIAGAILVLFIFGIGKAAIMPFHRWLPAAMVAPTPVSALLHAVAVVKAGVFTIIKVCLFIFGLDLLAILPSTQFLLYLAGITVLLSSLIAMRQDNLKARLAYSTVSQLGYITMGALLATSAGIIGSSMHIAMHAFGKITLFFCAGAILVAAHKSKISEMHGLGWQMPITMTAFFIGSLSIIGVPPTGGTWSKWFLLVGTLDSAQYFLMAALMISSLLNIAYLLPIPFRAFVPKEKMSREGIQIKEAPLPSLLALSLTALICLVLFVYPQPLYELVTSVFSTAEAAYGK